MSDNVIQALWDEHVGWSQTADRLKSRLTFWRSVVLTLTVVGAALQTLAATVGLSPIRLGAGAVGTVALALVPFLTRYFLTTEETRSWLRARSVSEGIKSEIFTYRASAEPYVDADALEKLRTKVREIREWGKNLESERAKIGAVTEPAPPSLDAKTYLDSRVSQQVSEYYRPKAKQNAERAEQFRGAEIIMAGLAAVLSASATFLGDPMSAKLGPWVAVLTTIGGSIAAHAAASRYDFQATTFFATARQLEDLAQDWQVISKSAPAKEWSELVHACEEAISAENRGWMAKLDEQR